MPVPVLVPVLVVAVTVAFVAVGSVRASQPATAVLREADAVAAALANPAFEQVLRGNEIAADAVLQGARQWRNPTLIYNREQIVGTGAASEDYLTWSQPLPVSGERRLAQRAARDGIAVQAHRNTMARADRVAAVRVAFARALWAQEQGQWFDRWAGHLREAVTIAADRVSAGDAARLHVERVRAELAGVELRRAQIEAERLEATAGVYALMGEAPGDPAAAGVLAGSLVPASVTGDVEVRSPDVPVLKASPQLAALRARGAQAQSARRAAGRAAVPWPVLNLGYKAADAGAGTGARQRGFTAGVGIPVPLGARAQGARRDADAEIVRARGDLALAQQQLQAQSEQLRRRAAALRLAVGSPAESELVELATLAYRGGEATTMELLDAYRSAIGNELRRLSIALELRQVQIERDRLVGRTAL